MEEVLPPPNGDSAAHELALAAAPMQVISPPSALWVAPVTDVGQAGARFAAMAEFCRSILKDTVDYGVIPGTPKPTLYQPGAQKLAAFFGLSLQMRLVDSVENWDSGLFHYRYRCEAHHGGLLVAATEASASTYEPRYRYRWVPKEELPPGVDLSCVPTKPGTVFEYDFAIQKAETTGQYGKSPEYWAMWKEAIESGRATKTSKKTSKGKLMEGYEMDSTVYRITNPDIAEVINTVIKIAQKRAMIGTVLTAVGGSQFFTQDLEDMEARFNSAIKPNETPAQGRARLMTELAVWLGPDEILAKVKHIWSILQLPPYTVEAHDLLRERVIGYAQASHAYEAQVRELTAKIEAATGAA